MTPLEALLQIKQMFSDTIQPVQAQEVEVSIEPAAPEYKEYVLKSGGKVKIDKLEVGGSVMLVDDMGNEAPAPAGEHELADGTIIVLDENSVILEVTTPTEEMPAAPVVDVVAQKIAELEAQISEMKKAKTAQDGKMSQIENKFSQAIKELSSVVIGLVSTPSAEATETPKDVFNKQKQSNASKIEKFLSLAKSIK